MARCQRSHPAERKYFKEMGTWPRPGKNGKMPKRVRDEMTFNRICFECDHKYKGDLKCPACKEPAGEVLEDGG